MNKMRKDMYDILERKIRAAPFKKWKDKSGEYTTKLMGYEVILDETYNSGGYGGGVECSSDCGSYYSYSLVVCKGNSLIVDECGSKVEKLYQHIRKNFDTYQHKKEEKKREKEKKNLKKFCKDLISGNKKSFSKLEKALEEE